MKLDAKTDDVTMQDHSEQSALQPPLCITELLSTASDKWLSASRSLKHKLIGNKRQKDYINNYYQRLIDILLDRLANESTDLQLKKEIVIILMTLAHAPQVTMPNWLFKSLPIVFKEIHNMAHELDTGLPQGLAHDEIVRLILICTQYLASIDKHHQCHIMLAHSVLAQPALIDCLLRVALISTNARRHVVTILTMICATDGFSAIIPAIQTITIICALTSSNFLYSDDERVLTGTLRALSYLISQNKHNVRLMITVCGKIHNDGIICRFFDLLRPEHDVETQLMCATCLTHIVCAGFLSHDDERVEFILLPTLICVSQLKTNTNPKLTAERKDITPKESSESKLIDNLLPGSMATTAVPNQQEQENIIRNINLRCEAMHTLALLCENSEVLQETAAVNQQCMRQLALICFPNSNTETSSTATYNQTPGQADTMTSVLSTNIPRLAQSHREPYHMWLMQEGHDALRHPNQAHLQSIQMLQHLSASVQQQFRQRSVELAATRDFGLQNPTELMSSLNVAANTALIEQFLMNHSTRANVNRSTAAITPTYVQATTHHTNAKREQSNSTQINNNESDKKSAIILERFDQIAQLQVATLTALSVLALNNESTRKILSRGTSSYDSVLQQATSLNKDLSNLPQRRAELRPKFMAVLRCLHAMSRSIEQQRSTFVDYPNLAQAVLFICGGTNSYSSAAQSTSSKSTSVWREDLPIMWVTTAVLANLMAHLSPVKEKLVEAGAHNLCCDLTQHSDAGIRLNAIWALTNTVYRAPDAIRSSVLNALGGDKLLCLLTDGEPKSPVIERCLCFLQNLLGESHSPMLPKDCCSSDSSPSASPTASPRRIDSVMSQQGVYIMQIVVWVLEGDCTREAKEAALRVLANVAAGGDASKQFIMKNEDVLRKLHNYIMTCDTRLRAAAITCIINLVDRDEPNSRDRQRKMKEIGMYKLLKQNEKTSDQDLYEIVKIALREFDKE